MRDWGFQSLCLGVMFNMVRVERLGCGPHHVGFEGQAVALHLVYRVTSLIRNRRPLGTWWSYGGSVSYERGTPVGV